MKTLRFIGMALLAVVLCVNLVACSDDDEPAQSGIEGTWLRSGQQYDGSYYYQQFVFEGNTWSLKDWSSYEKEPSNYEASGTYSISGDIVTIKYNDGRETGTYRFSLQGDKLVIYDFDEPGPNIFQRRK